MTSRLCGIGIAAILLAAPAARAQNPAPGMSAEAFAKLKKAALDTPKKMRLAPELRSAFHMGDGMELAEYKQIVAAGPENTKYFFMVLLKNDDVFIGTQTEEGVLHMFFTNPSLTLRNAATSGKNERLRAVLNIEAVRPEFDTIVSTFASLADSMP